MVEPIQGEGGVVVPSDDYLTQLRALCDQQDWLLILDEIQTGNARTGSYFHYQQHDILPDVVTLAKGLANGVPIGACLASGQAAELMKPGSHGSTFGGNPLACAAALATVNTIVDENLAKRAGELGETIRNNFQDALSGCKAVVDIRGRGLMIGIELDNPCGELVGKASERGLLINVTADKVVRLLPPLILDDAQAKELVATMSQLIIEWSNARK